jgi:threonine/homoserine/homoserine lactone efflux protein
VIALLLQASGLGLSCAASPGPFQAVLVAESLRRGPARAAPLALVPIASDAPAIAVVTLVLTQVPALLLGALTLAGGVVLLWLGAGALRAAWRPEAGAAMDPAASPGAARGVRGFLRAAAVNVTNPNVWIFWSTVGGPMLARAWRDAPAGALGFLAAFYACITAGNLAILGLAGGLARLGPRAGRALGVASGVALLGFGLLQLWRVVRG